MGGGWFPKLVWPIMINGQNVGVATGKVGVATATPAIRHSPPMVGMVWELSSYNVSLFAITQKSYPS